MTNLISVEECELIGALIGDGHIYKKNHKYLIGFTGNQITDKEYFTQLKNLISIAWKKEIKIKFREHAVRIQFGSKEIVARLTDFFGLPFNKGKCYVVEIPVLLKNNWLLSKHVIRGIVDTDGSIFTANKPGCLNYPSIEITTTSNKLALQIKEILLAQGFRVAKIWSCKSKLSNHLAYKIPLNGKVNLKKWVDEIGFSNPYKLNRALNAL